MDERLRTILCAIVESYIETSEPVGSRSLSRSVDLGVSPATIRNLMADLTEQGYLEQPHTSAGRVPTHKAYRLFVDACMEETAIPEEVKQVIERAVEESSHGLVSLLHSTCRLLSELTQFTSVVAAPRISQARLRVMEFLKIGPRQVYMVLITRSNMIYHKIIDVSEDFSQDYLSRLSVTLNENFQAENLDDARDHVLRSLTGQNGTPDQLLAQAVRLSRKAFDLSEDRELYVDGQSHIVNEFSDVEKIRKLLETFEEKRTLLELLDTGLTDQGIHLTIGEENPVEDLKTCSLVAANYNNGDQALGSIGVLGPIRMDYARIIPIIDYTARTLSAAITSQ